MSRYSSTSRGNPKGIENPHPIWRGIGFLIILIVPVLSYAASQVSMPYLIRQRWVPKELLGTPKLPEWLDFAPVLVDILEVIFVRKGMYATILVTFLYIVIIGGIISILYAILYRLFGPKKYGPLDAPPPKVKIKKYKR